MVNFKVLSTTWHEGQSGLSQDNCWPHQDSSGTSHSQHYLHTNRIGLCKEQNGERLVFCQSYISRAVQKWISHWKNVKHLPVSGNDIS